MDDTTKLQRELWKRWVALEQERLPFFEIWRDLSDYILPWGGRFFRTRPASADRSESQKRQRLIYNSTAAECLRILAAGLMAGASSPARPWFKLGTPDADVNSYKPAALWLSQASAAMHSEFQRSNTYQALPLVYRELGHFGTHATVFADSPDDLIHMMPLTAGEYCLEVDWMGQPSALFRKFTSNVGRVVKFFGKENCSERVRNAYDRGNLSDSVDIVHAIEPRADRDDTKRDSKNMPFASWYFEAGENGKLLRESGYREFPALCPRWTVESGDVYGNSPAMEALGTVMSLQADEFNKSMSHAWRSDPALGLSPSLRNMLDQVRPGGRAFLDVQTPAGTRPLAEPLVNVNFDPSGLMVDIQAAEQRIRASFLTDIFQLLSEDNTGRMTATEVAARNSDRMLQLGPVLGRMDNELLHPLIGYTFRRMIERGMLPQPPDVLSGMPLGIEMISVLAQAQKAVAQNTTDRFLGTIGTIMQMKPGAADKLDELATVDVVADTLGVDPRLIVANDRVAVIQQARAQAQTAQAQAAAAQQMSGVAKNLGAAQTGSGSNALNDLLNQYSGYASPDGAGR